MGIGPVRELFWRCRPVRCVKLLTVAEMFPVKELKERSRKISRGGKEEGKLPEKLLS